MLIVINIDMIIGNINNYSELFYVRRTVSSLLCSPVK